MNLALGKSESIVRVRLPVLFRFTISFHFVPCFTAAPTTSSKKLAGILCYGSFYCTPTKL